MEEIIKQMEEEAVQKQKAVATVAEEIERYKRINEKTRIVVFMLAVKYGKVKEVGEMVKEDPSLVTCQYNGQTALYVAVSENQMHIINVLLSSGADPYEEAAFEIALEKGYHPIVFMIESWRRVLLDDKEKQWRKEQGVYDVSEEEDESDDE